MRQRWWIGVVAVVGIVLAVLLFPRPDTGADIPTVDPTNKDPLDFGVERPTPAGPGPRAGRAQDVPDRIRTGPKPGSEALTAARNRPEIVYSGKIIAPWSAIRYVLLKVGTPEAKALADELGDGVMDDLRKIRTSDDPEGLWASTEPKMAETAAKLAASPWGSDETVVKSLERYQLLLKEFQEAKANGGVAPPAEGETPTVEGAKPAPSTEPAPETPPEE